MSVAILENVKQLHADRAAQDAKRRAKALADYRAALANPDTIDAKAMDRLITELGITIADVESDLTVLRDIARLTAEADGIDIAAAERAAEADEAELRREMLAGVASMFAKMSMEDVAITCREIAGRLPYLQWNTAESDEWAVRFDFARRSVPNLRSVKIQSRREVANLKRDNPRLFGQ